MNSPTPAAISAPPASATVVLRIVAGPHQGEEFSFDSHNSLVVGRAADAQWRMMKDSFFSRYHFRVEANPPDCWLVDLGSTNGTKVNGQRVQNRDLVSGDRIECGDTVFEVAISSATSQEDTPTCDIAGDKSRSKPIEIAGPVPHPEQLGDFRLGHELGRGAVGIVYRAVHQPSGRVAAIKLIKSIAPARVESMKLFLREVTVLEQLRHPRIVDYFSHGLDSGHMYLATEYLPVLGVRDVIASQSRPKQIRLACGVLCRVLEALQFAHMQDIVHRDVKPSNILAYKENGRLKVKLADFGLAKNYLHAGLSSISRESDIRGTLSYMAPEQLINCRFAKPPCDIYAVGVCLYVLLSGKLPFDVDKSPSAIALILNSPPRPIAERVHDLPAGLDAIVSRAMAREPADRFSSAEHMRQALLKFAVKK